MTQEEKNKYFWQQYNGEVLAENLPHEYVEYDGRIFCANEECFMRNKCTLFDRYLTYCNVYGRRETRSCIEDAKGVYDDIKMCVTYRFASFGMCPKQKGASSCKHYIEKSA